MLEISKYSTGESIFQFGEVRCIVEVPLSLPVRNANPGPAPVDQWNLPWFNEVFSHCRLQTSVYFKTGVSHDCRSKIFLINKLRTLYPVTCPSCAILLRIKFELQIVPQVRGSLSSFMLSSIQQASSKVRCPRMRKTS
ncbi:uncharacterized protein LOC111251064 isoform X3 [Varroa destructor]|uniref:Uncharacterized protein n=1 Tax=Varroa destructor TaxID=109461 RepID=A0A7M7K8A4_VARDE|nr:uncharacterized protein LOC111251064 isoform X3 [Varroa destructor]